MIDMLEENPRWHWSASGPDVCQGIRFFVIGSCDMVHLAAVELALQQAVEVAVGHHVVRDDVSHPHCLLVNKVGVAINHESCCATCLRHLHAM